MELGEELESDRHLIQVESILCGAQSHVASPLQTVTPHVAITSNVLPSAGASASKTGLSKMGLKRKRTVSVVT